MGITFALAPVRGRVFSVSQNDTESAGSQFVPLSASSSVNAFSINQTFPPSSPTMVTTFVAVSLTTSSEPSTITIVTTVTPHAYATDVCHVHLNETEDRSALSSDLFGTISLYDGLGNPIPQAPIDDISYPHGLPINAGNSSTFMSDLSSPLDVLSKHEDDYVAFQYGDIAWNSKTIQAEGEKAWCNTGRWNPRR